MSNAFGERFRIVTFGESHGPAVGVVVDGCPAGVPFGPEDLDAALARDVPDRLVGTPRREPNRAEVLSGVFEGATLGTPVAIVVRNEDARSRDYEARREVPRPGHGDLTWRQRYGRADWRGGGRASGRECVARLAAGALAAKVLDAVGVHVAGRVTEMAGVRVRSAADYARAQARVLEVAREGDSTGGLVRVTADGLPAGLGDPVFDKLHAVLGHALLSIGGVKSFEVGLGRRHARRRGSESNDPYELDAEGEVRTRGNRCGGVQGGISNGMRLVVDVAVKPTPSIPRAQESVDLEAREPAEVAASGRFDLNFAPRVAVVAEAMTAVCLVDRLVCAGEVHPLRLDASPLLRRRAGVAPDGGEPVR
ncbi:MAG: chorismate synthase [Planctomycetes bacterium]|nr:chorismate synthase [Planctomycetota bacterium]